MVSVVIPAFDEADTVGSVVAAARGHPDIAEVIVVDDGSSDGTAQVAAAAGARVLRVEHNGGKAAALDAGVRAAKGDVILFLDADVTGYTRETLSRIMQPVIDGRFEMYVGIRARSTVWLNRLLRFFPVIGGERAVTRRLWDAVPDNGRWSDGEFVIFMPEIKLHQAVYVAQRLVKIIADIEFFPKIKLPSNFAVLQRLPGEKYEMLTERLQKLLEKSRNEGENQICN
jgi:glycosyltransferase involved in cell wall biosynthesis